MKSPIYAVLGASLLSSFATAVAVPQGTGTGLTSQVPPPPCLVSCIHHVILLPPKPPALLHVRDILHPDPVTSSISRRSPICDLQRLVTISYIADLVLPPTVRLHPEVRQLRRLYP